MIARALGIWVAFCAPSALAAGLIGDSYFETVGGADVIPDNNVSVLAQDQQGFIWIGTPNGLIRYDGYRFRRFARDPNDAQSLSGVFIRALSVALDGRVWVGTDENGISVFDPASERFTRLTQADKDASSLPNNNVRAIAAAPDGGMWVGTRTKIGDDHQRAGRPCVVDVARSTWRTLGW